MTVKYGAEKKKFLRHVTKPKTHIHTHTHTHIFWYKVFNTYCCSTLIMVTLTYFNVMM
jgi:hypothetical protein